MVHEKEVRKEKDRHTVFLNKARTHGTHEVSLIMAIIIWVIVPSIVHPVFHPRMITLVSEVSWSLPVTLFACIFQAVSLDVSDLLTAIAFLRIPSVGSGRWARGSEQDGHEYVRYFCSGYERGVCRD